MQSYEKILYNAEIFFLFSWLKNYKKDIFFRHLQLKEVLVTGALGDMKMKETMTPRKQLIFYSFSKRLRNPVIINT